MDRLIAVINDAFGDVTLGNGRSLHQARAIDDWKDDAEVKAARVLDTETRWQDISDEKLDRLCDTLVFMDAAGFRFHMPRFMIFSLTHVFGERSTSVGVQAPIYCCDIMDETLRETVLVKLTLLSDAQKRAISRFLTFAAKHYDEAFEGQQAKHALEQYWNEYLD